MRFAPALVAVAALMIAGGAAAQNVTLAPVSYSPEFQQELERELGPREGVYLSTVVTNAVNAALARRGVTAGGPVRIEITIVDAQPNRFTMQQLGRRPGLDGFRSVSIGGAELRAVLRGADGAVLAEVDHSRYSGSLQDLVYEPGIWTDARRAIHGFAAKVADAYVAHAGVH